MIKIAILRKVLKGSGANLILLGFFIFVLILAGVFYKVEPDIKTYWDALWYCYVNLFTLGFGDIVPVTVIGRLLSVVLSIYASIVLAIVTGVIVTYFNEVVSKKYQDMRSFVLETLDDLPNLTKEELSEVKENIKKKL